MRRNINFKNTNDPLGEWHDIINENNKVIGRAQRIDFLKNKFLMRRSCHIWLVNSRGELWIHQRSKTKDIEPLYWTYAVGGFVRSGANSKTAILNEAKRELKEELGIKAKIRLVKVLPMSDLKIGKIMVYWYIGKYDGEFRPNPKEVKAIKAINPNELMRLYRQKKIKLVEPFIYELKYYFKNKNEFFV